MAKIIDEATIKKARGKCAYEGCRRKATRIVESHRGGADAVACFCEDHADVIQGQMPGEYTHNCPNCGCTMNIN